MTVPLSILDLAFLPPGGTAGEAFAACVAVAQRAEALGYRRVWYAEHHNIKSIASSATSVLIAHVGAHTKTIRLGAGGIMLPNHAPLVIAEQFGTLAALYPGRIDLGLGRAPGTDPATSQALGVELSDHMRFPEDVLELQAWLGDEPPIAGIEAIPGRGARVPLYILGSSLVGARLAAKLGLPYAFASHFAPAALEEALAIYRRDFRPSAQQKEPYAMAGVNVVAADTKADADAQLALIRRIRTKAILGRGQKWTDDEADAVLASPAGRVIDEMTKYTAVGTRDEVHEYLDEFARFTGVDELVVVFASPSLEARLRSVELTAR